VNTCLQSLPLSGRDLSDLSGFLLEQFAQFVHFQGGDLYFPPSWSMKKAEYIAGERTLIVPLLWQGRGIGAVRLLGVGAKEASGHAQDEKHRGAYSGSCGPHPCLFSGFLHRPLYRAGALCAGG